MSSSQLNSGDIRSKRFRLIFEQAPFSIQIFDKDGYIVEANQEWERVWDTSREELYKAKYNPLQDPQLEKTGITPYIRRVYQGERVEIPPLYYDPAQSGHPGRPRWLRTLMYPVVNEKNQVEEVVIIHEDITDRHETELQLKEKSAALEKLNRLLVGREVKMAELKDLIQEREALARKQ